MNVLNTYNEFDSNHIDLNIDHYGAEACDSGYSFGPSTRDNYVLHFIISGQGDLRVDGKSVSLGTGDLFLLPKNHVSFYQADRKEPWTYLWIGFSGSRADSLLQQTSLMTDYYAHSSLDSAILKQLLELFDSDDRSLTTINELRLLAQLYQLLASLLEEFPPINQDDGQQIENYNRQVLKIIHSQYDQPLKVSEIAKKLNLNRSYLYKIFKERTGYSIKEYLLKVRMEKGASLLKKTNLTITEIAHSVGFTDVLAFSKVFKKYFKKNPSCFRKEQLKKLVNPPKE